MTIPDLRVERQLEQFFAVQGWSGVRPDARIELVLPPLTLYFEYDARGVATTLAGEVAAVRRRAALSALLGLCRPEPSRGAPLTAFLLGPRLALRCLWPFPCELDAWVALYRLQQGLLERCLREAA